MRTGLGYRCIAAAMGALSLLVPRPAPGRATACPASVSPADPLVVAAAVAAWLYCGPPPTAGVVLSWHGRRVLATWVSINARSGPDAPSAVVAVDLLDPRAAPVVVDAVVARSGDPGLHRVVLTMFHRPGGGWAVDDLTILGTLRPRSASSYHPGYGS